MMQARLSAPPARMAFPVLAPACLLVLGLSMLVGCNAGPAATGPNLLIDPIQARELGYGIAWATDLGTPAPDRLEHVAVLGDLMVSVESPSHLITALSLRDGSIRWRKKLLESNDQLYEPMRWNNRIVINSETAIYLLSPDDGRLLEVQKVESVVNHAPALADSLAIFGGLNGRVFAHDLNTGYTRWAYQMPGGIVARPAEYRGQVFVADVTGSCAMVVAGNGSLMWRGRMFAQVTAPAAMGPQGVFVASHDQNLYALDRQTGRDRPGGWPYRTTRQLAESPMLIGSTVYLPIPREGLAAIDANTGQTRWQLPYRAEPIAEQDQRLMLLLGGRIQLVDTRTGAAVRQVEVSPLKTILPVDDSLILVTQRGRMVRLNPQR